MEEGDTVVDLKQAFLNAQIRLLNTPLQPSASWNSRVVLTDGQREISQSTIDEALYQANTIARHHNQAVYSSQAARHVAEQIDALYWNTGATDQPWGRAGDDDVLNKGVDLTDAVNVKRLPEEWPEDEGSAADRRRYESFRRQLVELSAKLDMQRTKQVQLEHMQTLVKPLKEPLQNVQPNLVSRDGELARELDKMRVLLARVSGKVQKVIDERPAREDEDMDDDQAANQLQHLLNGD